MRIPCFLAFIATLALSSETSVVESPYLQSSHFVRVLEHWSEHVPRYLSSISFHLSGERIHLQLERRRGSFHHNYRSTFVSSNGSTTGGLHSLEIYHGTEENWAVVTRISPGVFVGAFSWRGKDYHMDPSFIIDRSIIDETVIYPVEDVIQSSTPSNLTYAPVLEEAPSSLSNLLRLTRKRRQTVSAVKSRCSLEVVADHFFFDMVGHHSQAIATRYIAGLIERVNAIFVKIDWGEDNEGVPLANMGLSIKHILVHENPSNEANHYNSKSPTFLQHNKETPWDVPNLLQSFTRLNSARNRNRYCLRLLLTARPVNTSVRGMAYVANLSKSGGICADIQAAGLQYNTLVVNVYDGTAMRLLVTREVDLIISHEMGHAWGANHDEDYGREECKPSFRDGGLFIMHAHTLSGYDENNSKFSNCSRASIREILSDRRENCFEAERVSSCGNGLVEEGEECDEGGRFHDGIHHCCTHECTLIPEAKCSPLNEPCCSPTCDYHVKGYECQQMSIAHCSNVSRCTGISAKCPSPDPVFDGTPCVEGGVCLNGTCKSYCERLGKKSCMCEKEHESCLRCCSSSSSSGESLCVPVEGAPILPDGFKCIIGRCNNSTCIRDNNDIVSQFFGQLSDRSSWTAFISSNLVAILIIFSLCVYLPIACCITTRDNNSVPVSIAPLPQTKHRTTTAVYTPVYNQMHNQVNNQIFNR
ncbi:hypothetical protein PENTCL1PPCAC_26443 [Pristionchus entomophagus]|uniref:Uncharacterized protein n=1 Tax=Pristionchus entomophagus TaxID=358040 RepID=A0AAV5UE37_9BILA|nr:hypothetical protein PENTCL1PPCAC_26443 [Pristionchus entomophagus]